MHSLDAFKRVVKRSYFPIEDYSARRTYRTVTVLQMATFVCASFKLYGEGVVILRQRFGWQTDSCCIQDGDARQVLQGQALYPS